MYGIPRAADIRYPEVGLENNGNVFSHSSGAYRFTLKVLVGSCSKIPRVCTAIYLNGPPKSPKAVSVSAPGTSGTPGSAGAYGPLGSTAVTEPSLVPGRTQN